MKYPPQKRLLHERLCMIVMLHLWQHEIILFRAHDAMGHQGIAKVLGEDRNAISGQAFVVALVST